MQIYGLTPLSTTGLASQDRLTSDATIRTRNLVIQTDPAEANDVIVYGANSVKIGKCPGGGASFVLPISQQSQAEGETIAPYDYTVEAAAGTTVYINYERRPAY